MQQARPRAPFCTSRQPLHTSKTRLFLLQHQPSHSRHTHIRRRVATDPVTTTSEEASDYYALLGLNHTATSSQIKRAYRQFMKEYHPDQSADDENHEFAVFLNHVYETLMDQDSRAEYDAISGFTFSSVNPFRDTSYEADLVFVDEFACIGCTNCTCVCPKTFELEDEYGRARVMDQGNDTIDKLQEAIDTCPVSCIHWVTPPQLTLLEETMANMERVAVWLLMSQGGRGANLNVFVEASIAWEKRRAEMQRREDKAKWVVWNSNFGPAAGSTMTGTAEEGSEEEDNEAYKRAAGRRGKNVDAKSIAKAARKWRDYARKKRQREQRLLSS